MSPKDWMKVISRLTFPAETKSRDERIETKRTSHFYLTREPSVLQIWSVGV